MGLVGAGCASVDEPVAVVDPGPYQAQWINDVLGQTANIDACLARFPAPGAVFHAENLDHAVLGLMIIDADDEAHACTVLDQHVLETVAMEDVTRPDLRGTPHYVPGESEPEAASRRAYRAEDGSVVGWVFWP